MRLRKSTRLIAKAEAAEAASWTAGREVYRCADVRREILRWLARPDLARCMRVSREAWEDVAGILYKSRSGEQMRPYITSEEPRHKLYCSSLTDLLEPPYWSIEQLREALKTDSKLPRGAAGKIHTELMEKLQKQYPNLRRLHTSNSPRGGPSESWVIQIEPGPRELDGSSPHHHPILLPPLQIQIVHNRNGELHEDPPKAFESPYASSQVYTIQYRFDLRLNAMPFVLDDWRTDEWLKVIRESPSMGNIHKVCDLSEVSVNIDDLIAIYNRQIGYGHSQRLASIFAYEILPFSIEDFGRLTAVAGSSLTNLNLGLRDGQACRLDFTHLPALVSLIKRDLVNLKVLAVSVWGDGAAEEICRALLRKDMLEEEGTVTELHIGTATVDAPLFNALRYLSVVCARKAEVCVGSGGEWSGEVQTQLLEYLRSQSPAARSHLSTLDFPASLDITSPAQIMALQYYDDGRPRPRRQVKAEGWRDVSQFLTSYTNDTIIPSLIDSVESLAASATRFKKAATHKSTDRMLEEADGLLESLEEAIRVGDLGRTIVANAVDMRKEVREFVDMVKDINGIDRDLEVEDEY